MLQQTLFLISSTAPRNRKNLVMEENMEKKKLEEAKKLIAQASKMIQEQYAPEEDKMKVYVIRVEAQTVQEVMDILDYAGYDADLLEVYED